LRSRIGSASTRGWDYVVVGAGAAGCVVAGRLSRTMPDVRIALIEAGGARLGLTTKVPGTAFIASTSPRRNWNFETEPVPALNGRKLWWFQGRILGGSGSINGMLYLRGHSLEYDQWAQLGCHGWSFDQVLPYFKKAETNTRGANEWHGDSGPITVKPSRVDLPICEAFLAAAGEAGFSVVDDLNADIAEGFGSRPLSSFVKFHAPLSLLRCVEASLLLGRRSDLLCEPATCFCSGGSSSDSLLEGTRFEPSVPHDAIDISKTA